MKLIRTETGIGVARNFSWIGHSRCPKEQNLKFEGGGRVLGERPVSPSLTVWGCVRAL